MPVTAANQRRKQGSTKCQKYNNRGVYSGEFGNKTVYLRLACCCIFYGIQNSGVSIIGKWRCNQKRIGIGIMEWCVTSVFITGIFLKEEIELFIQTMESVVHYQSIPNSRNCLWYTSLVLSTNISINQPIWLIENKSSRHTSSTHKTANGKLLSGHTILHRSLHLTLKSNTLQKCS